MRVTVLNIVVSFFTLLMIAVVVLMPWLLSSSQECSEFPVRKAGQGAPVHLSLKHLHLTSDEA